MERENSTHILFPRTREQRFERAHRTQFNIQIFRVIQKSIKQVTAFPEREISYSALARIASRDNESRGLVVATGQDRQLFFDLVKNIDKAIQPKLEQIGWFAHATGETQVGDRSDHADKLRTRFFDRSARCHILNDSKNTGRAMIAPL